MEKTINEEQNKWEPRVGERVWIWTPNGLSSLHIAEIKEPKTYVIDEDNNMREYKLKVYHFHFGYEKFRFELFRTIDDFAKQVIV